MVPVIPQLADFCTGFALALQHPRARFISLYMRMHMTLTPSSALGSAEPVVYAPKPAFPPAFRRIDEEDASPVAVAHLPHPPPASSTVFPPWSTTATDVKPETAMTTHPAQMRHTELTSTVLGRTKQSKGVLFVCPEVHCGKQFPRSFALRRHMRIHTGTKPYACDYQGCSQRFNTSGNLSRHKRIHSGERPYPCCFESCGKRFNTSTKLKRHMRIHFPDGQNLFRCTEQACSWACDNYKEYVQHQKLHSRVAEGFINALDENMNVSNDNALGRKSLKNVKPMSVMVSDTEPQHMEFPQHVQHSVGNEDFFQQDRSRMYGDGSGAPSALMMMQKEDQQQRKESDYRRLSGTSVLVPKTFLDERTASQAIPRLPFPTRAFPSEPVVMPSSGLLGSSFHPSVHLSSHRYCDSAVAAVSVTSSGYSPVCSNASVPYSSYIRDGETNVLVRSFQPTLTTTTFMTSSEQQYTQSGRQEDMDHHYESSSPHNVRQQQPHSQSQSGYGGNPVPPELTGEELSAVLELMKDS